MPQRFSFSRLLGLHHDTEKDTCQVLGMITRKPLPPSTPSLPNLLKHANTYAPLLSHSSKSKHQIISTRGRNWNWEIGALVLSNSALTALLVLLAYADGRALAEWNSNVSLNALISILGAISRTSLGFAISSCLGQAKWNWFKRRTDNVIAFDRFDDASRGPWGSLWLIFWLRAR
jgi:hypothetical protein